MSNTTITELINQYGYLAIAFLIAIENIFPPIPSEVVLVFTGYLTLNSQLTIWGSILAATIGAYLGAVMLYGVGRLLSVKQLERLVAGRLGRLLRLKASDIEKAANYFNHHGGKAILIGRCIPVVRSLISIPAGMTTYPFARFTGLTLIGTLTWNTVLILVGHYAGSAWMQMLKVVDQWLVVILLIAAVSVGGYLYYRHIAKRKKKH